MYGVMWQYDDSGRPTGSVSIPLPTPAELRFPPSSQPDMTAHQAGATESSDMPEPALIARRCMSRYAARTRPQAEVIMNGRHSWERTPYGYASVSGSYLM